MGNKPNRPVRYPDGDSEPMCDNTRQYRWIVTIKENLDARLPDFVAADLLWYPVQGDPKTRIGPDVLVALGRPKGDRGSYRQWEEDGVAPQVVFEIFSPRNAMVEMVWKGTFFARHGVMEFYAYDPESDTLHGWTVEDGQLTSIEEMGGWVSPLLGIRFDLTGPEMRIFDRTGAPFWTVAELEQRAKTAAQHAESAEERAARLAAKLRALGIDPEAVLAEE